MKEHFMKSTLDYRDGYVCILNEPERFGDLGDGIMREWYVVREAAEAEAATLIGRPVKHLEANEGLYIDEEGNVYQLKDKGETQPIAVEHLPGKEKTELESLLEASLNGENASGQLSAPKRLFKRKGGSSRKH